MGGDFFFGSPHIRGAHCYVVQPTGNEHVNKQREKKLVRMKLLPAGRDGICFSSLRSKHFRLG